MVMILSSLVFLSNLQLDDMDFWLSSTDAPVPQTDVRLTFTVLVSVFFTFLIAILELKFLSEMIIYIFRNIIFITG